MMKFTFIRSLSDIDQDEVNLFGGKNASLGHLTKTAQALHLNIPAGSNPENAESRAAGHVVFHTRIVFVRRSDRR